MAVGCSAGWCTDSWGRAYTGGRFGVDLAGDERFRPGQAPAGWTNLVDHLRGRGVSDAEMVATGVATEASTGRLIDRFRDRVVFPVIHQSEVLGFVGRRRPNLTDADKGGPKYRSEEHTSELQSLMRISYAVFCLKKKKQ